MNPKLLESLDLVLDDVIDVLNESGWDDEAEWYDDLRQGLLTSEPGSPRFNELLIELEQSFLGFGSFSDIPLTPALADAIDTHHQRLGLVSCACGVIHQIKQAEP